MFHAFHLLQHVEQNILYIKQLTSRLSEVPGRQLRGTYFFLWDSFTFRGENPTSKPLLWDCGKVLTTVPQLLLHARLSKTLPFPWQGVGKVIFWFTVQWISMRPQWERGKMVGEQHYPDTAPAPAKINEAINKTKNDSICAKGRKSLKNSWHTISPGEEKEDKERKKKQLRIESFFPSKGAIGPVSTNNSIKSRPATFATVPNSSSVCQEAGTCLLNAKTNKSTYLKPTKTRKEGNPFVV